MKLIDILVQELPKRGGWPEDCHAITQDSDKAINEYSSLDGVEINEHGTWRAVKSWNDYCVRAVDAPCLAVDYHTAIITREQYEAALAEKEHPLPWDEKNKPCPTLGAECRGCPDCGRRVSCTSDDITDDAVRAEMGMNSRTLDAALAAKNDGWIEWGGGECPVPEGALVDVRYRNSEKFPDTFGTIALAVGGYGATGRHWNHDGYPNDIIAYRLHQPQETEQPKADEEADLNECIGHGAAPVWNGEGLPPVGCECEMQDGSGYWIAVDIIANKDGFTFGWSYDYRMVYFSDKEDEFRPLRSEADKKREEAIMSLAKYGGAASFKYGEKFNDGSLIGAAWYELYDAIAAGKVRGVKLEG